MPKFELHPQLKNDTFLIGSLDLSQILLMNDSRYPWIILVPRIGNAVDITDLSFENRQTFVEEINFVADALKKQNQPDRINIAMLGNVVPQLHCHIIARFETDFAWSKPVWGIGDATIYTTEEHEKTVSVFRDILLKSRNASTKSFIRKEKRISAAD
jgi:diadenosine tetraphosphate (Ap4A) HIT family hydrolase